MGIRFVHLCSQLNRWIWPYYLNLGKQHVIFEIFTRNFGLNGIFPILDQTKGARFFEFENIEPAQAILHKQTVNLLPGRYPPVEIDVFAVKNPIVERELDKRAARKIVRESEIELARMFWSGLKAIKSITSGATVRVKTAQPDGYFDYMVLDVDDKTGYLELQDFNSGRFEASIFNFQSIQIIKQE